MEFNKRAAIVLTALALNLWMGGIASKIVEPTAQAVEPESKIKSALSAPAREDGIHDMILMLPNRPVHLRIQVTEAGKSLVALRAEYLRRLFATLDADRDGKVSRQETAKHPLFVAGRRFSGNKFLDSLRSEKNYGESELALAVERAAGRLLTFRQNNALTEQDRGVFQVLDENSSGSIDRAEMRTAPARLALRDLDFDQCITFDEFLTQTSPSAANAVVVNESEPPDSVRTELLRDATEPILGPRLFRKYDANRDAKLSGSELGWTSPKIDALDRDGDQLLDIRELSRIAGADPDLSLSLDLNANGAGSMNIVGGGLATQASTMSTGQVRLSSSAMALNVGYTHRNLFEEARDNALNAFNAIDLDANGYLDRKEIAQHQRFERYLFDAMDFNGDSRVFADEMLSYVQAYTEPAATTCQITLFDTGNGFFQILDQNGDGRISVRELRKAEENLLAKCDAQQAIDPKKLSKSFRISIQRGGVSLFGRVDRPEAESPTIVLQPGRGPIWFQRMDRNSDNDLVWDEFLGPREVFHRLDRDQDGLIDASEAASYRREE